MPENIKILLVDDEPKNLIALESLLQAEGRDLIVAASGFEALRRLLEDDFALILLDVRMPEMDGFEAAELIRARDRSRDTPIIFLTAAAGEFPMVRGYALGAVDYIIKPVDPDVLRFKVAVFADLYRKSAEVREQAEQIAAQRAFLESVLEGVTEHGIAALDREGRVQVWNEGARRIYGRTAETMIGKPAAMLAVEWPDFTDILRRVGEDGRVEVESEHVSASGRRFPTIVSISQRTDEAGEPAGYVFVSRDLTARRQAEEARVLLVRERAARAAAEERQRHLQQLIDVSPEAVLITDERGRLTLTNAAGRTLFGELPQAIDLLQGGLSQVLSEDGEACPPASLPLARALVSGEPVRGEQYVVSSAAGQRVPVLVSAAAVTEVDGRISGGVMILQDVSVLKALDRQKDDFLAAVAHDLRNPLTIIAGNAQLLERRIGRLGTPESTAFVDLLRSTLRTTRRATAMVNELLDLTRTQMQRPIPLDPSQFDLGALTRDVAGEIQRTTERHEIRLEVEETAGTWDRDRLYRVISNLVENAVKYSPQGGPIDVCLKPQLDESGQQWAELTVKDRGVGIPSDDLPHIFGRFYRASNVFGRIEGSGIGLTAALQVAQAHGGGIVVDSAPGAGTTVHLRLPLLTAPAAGRAR